VRVLTELGLASFNSEGPDLVAAESPERTALERSAAYRAYQRRLEDGRRYLTSSDMTEAAA
jgi:single-stranded-DNA-specific exonuclease